MSEIVDTAGDTRYQVEATDDRLSFYFRGRRIPLPQWLLRLFAKWKYGHDS